MAYPVENALFQWEDGERRLAEADDATYRRATDDLVERLRKRLGSSFTLEELADLYASGAEFDRDPSWLVDAAFGRYAREAMNFAGGRPLSDSERVGR
ncbi:MAG TPA: hypothetical protein VD790_02085 [Thermoleophilaceae bacterium]|nr:hypothetical protein [Thermoleophilaceae bacterium]